MERLSFYDRRPSRPTHPLSESEIAELRTRSVAVPARKPRTDDDLFVSVCGALGIEPDAAKPKASAARERAEREWIVATKCTARGIAIEQRRRKFTRATP